MMMMTGMHTCQDPAGSGTRGRVLGNPTTFWEQPRYLISNGIYINYHFYDDDDDAVGIIDQHFYFEDFNDN